MASIAPLSDSCFRPFAAIIVSTSPSSAHIASNTCLAALFEIVPSAIRLSKCASCCALMGEVLIFLSSLFNLAETLPITQLAVCFGSAPALTTATK